MEKIQEKDMDLKEILEMSNKLNDDVQKLLGKNFDDKLEKIQIMDLKLAKNNLETTQIAKDCIDNAEKWKTVSETNPFKERIDEIRDEITDLDVQIKEAEAEIDYLHEVLVQTKIDSHPISSNILNWNKHYIEVHFPTRLREIEEERLKCIKNLPGFGEPPKYSKNLETVESELKTLQESNTEIQMQIDQMNADKKMTVDFESEIAKINLNMIDLEKNESNLDGSENELLREIFQLELDVEVLKREIPNDSEIADQAAKTDDEDENIIDLTTLFKNPNDFPDLMTFLEKAHNKSDGKSKTPPNKSQEKTSPIQHAMKRKINMSPKTATSSEKRLCVPKSPVVRELLPRASKSSRVSTNLFGARNLQSPKPSANNSLSRTKSSRNLLQDKNLKKISNYAPETSNASDSLQPAKSFIRHSKKKVSIVEASVNQIIPNDDLTKTPSIEKSNEDESTASISPITNTVVTSTPIAAQTINVENSDIQMKPIDDPEPIQIDQDKPIYEKENQVLNTFEKQNQQIDLLNKSKSNVVKPSSQNALSPELNKSEKEINGSIDDDLFDMDFDDKGKFSPGNLVTSGEGSFNLSGDEFEFNGGGGGEIFNVSGGFEGMNFDFDLNASNDKKKDSAANSKFDGNDFSSFF
ncbi:hypothetical protein PVAND_006544 [Polypedilum vanderplanki]|uniref:Uncharacterized protein n=1 Tax=Polypedilum vanderplanki TaxID=319348 RepID=A0A9J6C3Z6_POLVA|nr:hypothetical protein PVAND_006544 [Polypedilum vanderplanki]